MLIEVRKKNQITLPIELIKQFDLKEGDVLTVETNKQQIILKPAVVIPKDQLPILRDKIETYVASESTLRKDWLEPAEDIAWKNL
jgi:AbrB family looped-hinge helix DNA binding protein